MSIWYYNCKTSINGTVSLKNGGILPALILTLSSNAATAIPDAAPDPAKPMKCSLPMLLANNDAPTYKK